MQAKDPLENLNQKKKAQWNISWVGFTNTEVSTEPIVPQSLYIIPNNIVTSLEQIFQDQ
jgi:hypothetical protein